jgi:single-strand DNA-binding protein
VSATDITVIGNVVNSPTRNRTQNGSVTNFRVASTERRFDSATQEWTDGPSFFVDVECWGELGGNVAHTLSKGDPVVVVGVIRTSEWESDQGRRSRPQIKAEAVAPNLARGTADFRRTPRAATALGSSDPESPQDEGLPGSPEGTGAGRDYDDAGQALDSLDATDLTAQPVHA